MHKKSFPSMQRADIHSFWCFSSHMACLIVICHIFIILFCTDLSTSLKQVFGHLLQIPQSFVPGLQRNFCCASTCFCQIEISTKSYPHIYGPAPWHRKSLQNCSTTSPLFIHTHISIYFYEEMGGWLVGIIVKFGELWHDITWKLFCIDWWVLL